MAYNLYHQTLSKSMNVKDVFYPVFKRVFTSWSFYKPFNGLQSLSSNTFKLHERQRCLLSCFQTCIHFMVSLQTMQLLKQFYSKPEVQRSKKTVTGATTFARMNVSYETFAKTDKETFQNERFVRDIRKN